MSNEICENCGRIIGKLEAAHVWKDHVVCDDCLRRLNPAPLAYATPVQLTATPIVGALPATTPAVPSAGPPASRWSRFFTWLMSDFGSSANQTRDDQQAQLAEELRKLERKQRRAAQDNGQRMGCLLIVVGVILMCLFWPAGVVLILVGLVLAAVNTRLS